MVSKREVLVAQSVSLVALCAVSLSAISNESVRLSAAALLILVVPGWTVGVILVPNHQAICWERLVLSLGLGFAIAIVVGLSLNATPWGLDKLALLVAVVAISVAASIPQFVKGRRTAVSSHQVRWPRMRAAHMLLLLAATLLMAASIQVARIGALEQPYAPFTQLWMLPAESASEAILSVGFKNMEGRPTTYNLQICNNDVVLMEWPGLELAQGEVWQKEISVPESSPERDRIEARLFKSSDPRDVYRHVDLSETPKRGD